MDGTSVPRRISRITQVEPNLCYRSPAELERAMQEDRWFSMRIDGELAGFLFAWPYGDWIELGTGYVVPEHRNQGVYTRLHHQALDELEQGDTPAFEFPGNGAVQRVLEKVGFERSPYTTLPLEVWREFLRERRRPDKIRSYVEMLKRDEPLHSAKLYTYEPRPRQAEQRPVIDILS